MWEYIHAFFSNFAVLFCILGLSVTASVLKAELIFKYVVKKRELVIAVKSLDEDRERKIKWTKRSK